MMAADLWRESAWQGLRAWSGFPADREPRPLVLLTDAVHCGAFPDGDKKVAFVRRAIEAVPGFPDPVLRALRSGAVEHAGPPLVVITARLASTKYLTDRGRLELPAWEVHARDVPERLWVLDPAVSERVWQPPEPNAAGWLGNTAVLDASGRTVTMTFTGSPYADYPDAEILQSGAAVAILPRRVLKQTGTSRSGVFTVPLVGQFREVTVTLAEPLGPRVLLDPQGSPVMVTT